jgi:hypothetical protein
MRDIWLCLDDRPRPILSFCKRGEGEGEGEGVDMAQITSRENRGADSQNYEAHSRSGEIDS